MRTDVHKPSVIIPADYDFVSHAYLGSDIGAALVMQQERKVLSVHMAKTGGTYAHVETTGNCQVCGSVNALYTLYFYHAKSNTYVNIGPDCAGKLYDGADRIAFKQGTGRLQKRRKPREKKNFWPLATKK